VSGDKNVMALESVTLSVKKGEFVVVRGPSGSGKSTLLLTIGGMLKPSSGTVTIADQAIYAMRESARALFRAKQIGFIFQMFHLLPYLNVTENVMLPAGTGARRVQQSDALALLEWLGLKNRATHRPAELSAGERQRTAIARALLNHPGLVLADEPTGNLDPDNAREVIRHLAEYRQQGGTVVIVTHGVEADACADRILYLNSGRFEELS